MADPATPDKLPEPEQRVVDEVLQEMRTRDIGGIATSRAREHDELVSAAAIAAIHKILQSSGINPPIEPNIPKWLLPPEDEDIFKSPPATEQTEEGDR
jgi:hypothetical protein